MEDNILDEMGIQPFPDDDSLDIDEQASQPAIKRPTSIRLADGIKREIDWLIGQGYGNQSEVIALAVHQMYALAAMAADDED